MRVLVRKYIKVKSDETTALSHYFSLRDRLTIVPDAALAVKVYAMGENEGCPGHFEGLSDNGTFSNP